MELVFREFRLLQNGTESSCGHIPGVHRQVGLPPVTVAQHEMRSALPTFLETGTLEKFAKRCSRWSEKMLARARRCDGVD